MVRLRRARNINDGSIDFVFATIETADGAFKAATERQPGWHRSDVNASKIDDSAPDYPEVLEWFRRSFSGRDAGNRGSHRRGPTAEASARVRRRTPPVLALGAQRRPSVGEGRHYMRLPPRRNGSFLKDRSSAGAAPLHTRSSFRQNRKPSYLHFTVV